MIKKQHMLIKRKTILNLQKTQNIYAAQNVEVGTSGSNGPVAVLI